MRRRIAVGLARCLLWLSHGFNRVASASLYLAVGTLPLKELRRGIAGDWSAFLIDREDVLAGWMHWEGAVVQAWVVPGERVFVVGCGSGRDVLPFLRLGCTVSGVDPARQAVEVARSIVEEEGLSASLSVGFFPDCEVEGRFDVVWFSWNVYSFIPDSRRRVRALLVAAAHLSPGGRIVLSYVHNPAPPVSRARAFGRRAGRLAGADWRLESGDVVHRVGGTAQYIYEHHFGPGEIDGEVGAAGLRIAARFAGTPPVLVLTPEGETPRTPAAQPPPAVNGSPRAGSGT